INTYSKKNLKEVTKEIAIKVDKDFLKDYFSREVLLTYYIIVYNSKSLFIFNILINSGINGNIFVNK
ncbi:hypothetical protein OFB79_23935, partial [Escherichia coli]|nr:hypothetical protein [Escherichia coli]